MTVPIPESKRRNNAIRAAAKAAGQSVQAYVLQACAERMTREGQPLTIDAPADHK